MDVLLQGFELGRIPPSHPREASSHSFAANQPSAKRNPNGSWLQSAACSFALVDWLALAPFFLTYARSPIRSVHIYRFQKIFHLVT